MRNHPTRLERAEAALTLKGIGKGIVDKLRKLDPPRHPLPPAPERRKPRASRKRKRGEESTTLTFEPGSFDVSLVLDTREIKNKSERDYIPAQLRECGVDVKVRQLALGDMLWIARRHDDNAELVLDHIVERKTKDDLVRSITDGRFREQKERLTRSGIARVVYIFEDGPAPEFNQQAIDTAIYTTLMVDGFFVKRTTSTDRTIAYLADLHAEITATHGTTQTGIRFDSFNARNTKKARTTLGDLFAKMLATVRDVSGATALEIAAHYKTPSQLIEAYAACSDDDQRQTMVCDALGRKTINRTASKNVWETWCS